MSHDIVIRGGTVFDGTGAKPIEADIAIDGATIVAVGKVHVEHDYLGLIVAQMAQGFLGRGGQRHLGYAGIEQRLFDREAEHGIIFHHEHMGR